MLLVLKCALMNMRLQDFRKNVCIHFNFLTASEKLIQRDTSSLPQSSCRIALLLNFLSNEI